MTLSHEQFFALAIDPDGEPDPKLVPEIEEHRRTCSECAQLEREYPKILEAAKTMDFSMPPASPGREERVMKAAREAIAARKAEAWREAGGAQKKQPRRAAFRVLAMAATIVVSLGAGIGIDRGWLQGEAVRLPKSVLGQDDVQIANFLEEHHFHDQAKVLAQHALDAGGLSPAAVKEMRAIVARQ